jgi:hypothetical protein
MRLKLTLEASIAPSGLTVKPVVYIQFVYDIVTEGGYLLPIHTCP